MATFHLYVLLAVSVMAGPQTSSGAVTTTAAIKSVVGQTLAMLKDTLSDLLKLPCQRRIKLEKDLRSDLLTTRQEFRMLNTTLQETKAELELLKSSIMAKVNKNQNTFTSFEVKQQKHPLIVNNNGVLRFDTVALNVGDGYDASSGIFEAPVSGIYLFWANVRGVHSGLIYIHLIKEGRRIANGYSSRGPSYGDVASLTYIAEVIAGDKLWFEKTGNTNTINGFAYSSYGAALLHAK